MVEAGPILSAAFLAPDLVDEAALFRSREPLGEGDRGAGRHVAWRLDAVATTAIDGREQVGRDTLQLFERK